MSDYSNLLKNELIDLLQQRDQEIIEIRATLQEQQRQNGLLIEKVATLQAEIDEQAQPGMHTIDGIIDAILTLPDEEKQAFPFIVRTTEAGIRAYTTMIYGGATEIPVTD